MLDYSPSPGVLGYSPRYSIDVNKPRHTRLTALDPLVYASKPEHARLQPSVPTDHAFSRHQSRLDASIAASRCSFCRDRNTPIAYDKSTC